MHDLDKGTKGILQFAPEGLLSLAFGPGVRDVRARPTERVSNLRLRDGLFDARIDGRRAVAHVEVEATPRRRTERRIAGYWHQLRFTLRHPVRIAVVYLERGGWRGPVPASFGLRCPDGRWTRVGFDTVALWELDAAATVTRGSAGLLPLVPFMRGGTPALVHRALDRLRRLRAPLQERAELQVVTAMFAGRVFPRLDWLGTLGEEVTMTSTTYQQIERRGLEKGLAKGREEGLEKGREEGLEKGREEVLAQLRRGIVDVVRELHGRAPRGLTGCLARIDGEALRGLLVLVARAGSAEEALSAVEAAAKRRAAPRRRPRR